MSEEQLSLRQLAKEMSFMNTKIDQIISMISDVARQEANPAIGKVQEASISNLMSILETSGLDKHPQFAKMMEPIKEILKTQQG